jgi:putative transposase
MSELHQSQSHSKWDCKYHVVFVPKRRRKIIFGQTRRQLGPIFHSLARQKECQILEGHLMPDHVPMCIAILPKHPVASVIGFLKGKSAIAIGRLCGKERNFSGEHFWARATPSLQSGSNWSRFANTSLLPSRPAHSTHLEVSAGRPGNGWRPCDATVIGGYLPPGIREQSSAHPAVARPHRKLRRESTSRCLTRTGSAT